MIIKELPAIGIFLSSFLALFFELLLIRYQDSILPVLAYFKNITLLACFLGLGIGFSLGKSNKNFLPFTVLLIVLQLLFLYGLRYFTPEILNSASRNQSIPIPITIIQAIYIYSSLGIAFILSTIACIPLGHYASYLMSLKQPLISYSINLAGSLSAIVLFSFLSFLSTPLLIWYLVTLVIIFWFLRNNSKLLYLTIFLSLFIFIGEIVIKPKLFAKKNFITEVYSPYNHIIAYYFKDKDFPCKFGLTINHYFNHTAYDLSKKAKEKCKRQQNIRNFEMESLYYDAPYRVKSDIKNVLVLGSGTGNHVASALRANVKSIDAVEIDPKIAELGKLLHPEKPYSDPRVKLYINDARNYIKNCKKKYDLIIYGSITSFSSVGSLSNIRLESFIYTTEALKKAKELLKKDGMIFLSFFSNKEMIIAKRFSQLIQNVFDGKQPFCYKRTSTDNYPACLISKGDFKLPIPNSLNLRLAKIIDLTKTFETRASFDFPSDDWPFMYMPKHTYPLSYLVMILVLSSISIILIKIFFVQWRTNFNPQFFFLGAGFMLIETKGITELGVEFGNTWYVVAIIISAILVLAFLANLVIIKLKNINTNICYIFLLSIILLEALFWISSKLTFLPLAVIPYLKLTILTLPIFFSGLIFSNELKRRSDISSVFSSNLLGSMCGGFLEYNALYTGYHALTWLAFVIYSLAMVSCLVKR